MAKFFPPKGYKETDQPLLHFCKQVFSLNGEDPTKDSTIVTLFKQTEACNAPENVEVNNSNDNYATDAGNSIHHNSIVDKLKVRLKMSMTKDAVVTDNLRQLNVNWAPMYIAFLNNLDAEDEKSGDDIESLVQVQHDTVNKDVYPLFAGAKMVDAGSVPLSTVGHTEVLADVGLTTTAILESVAFSSLRTWFTRLKYYSNSGMMKSVIPRWHTVRLSRDKAYQRTINNINSKVKRANNYMFCGIVFHMPTIGGDEQFYYARDSTNIPHIEVKVSWAFEEWNTAFEQASI